MTPQQLEQSIATGKLQLTFWQKFTHYGIVAYMAVIPIVFMCFAYKNWFQEIDRPAPQGELWFYIVPSFLALGFYVWQSKKLQLTLITTTLNRDEVITIIEQVARDNKWTFKNKNKAYIVAITSHRIFFDSCSERVTIIFKDKNIYFNSICDPDAKGAVTSWGNNKRNLKILTEALA